MRINVYQKLEDDKHSPAGLMIIITNPLANWLVSAIDPNGHDDEGVATWVGRTNIDNDVCANTDLFIAHLTQLIRSFCMNGSRKTPDEIIDLLSREVNTNTLVPHD